MPVVDPDSSAPAPRTAKTPGAILIGLADTARSTVTATLTVDRIPVVASCYQFLSELEAWSEAITSAPEIALYEAATEEYAVSLLCVCQGQYRNAFKSLRLVLELYLQGVALSADAVSLHEWLTAAKDTNWTTLMSQDNGVFSKRFCRAFFPELDENVDSFRSMSVSLYRELSECVHGNIPTQIPLPKGMVFDKNTFDMWVEKATTLRMIVHFAFVMRRLNSISEHSRTSIYPGVIEQLGHIPLVRAKFGGPI